MTKLLAKKPKTLCEKCVHCKWGVMGWGSWGKLYFQKATPIKGYDYYDGKAEYDLQ